MRTIDQLHLATEESRSLPNTTSRGMKTRLISYIPWEGQINSPPRIDLGLMGESWDPWGVYLIPRWIALYMAAVIKMVA